jgi:hypothetical protein
VDRPPQEQGGPAPEAHGERRSGGAAEEGAELLRRLREADGEALLALVSERLAALPVTAVRQALRNPFASEELTRLIGSEERLVRIYEVRRDLAGHRRSPPALAQRFVPGLFWRDLVAIGLDARISPRVRHSADRFLIERLPGLAVGERVTIARRASPAALPHLRRDPSRQVIAALLENPRLTEGVLVPMVASETTLPAVLELVAKNRRWGNRYGVRQAICRNPRTPTATALQQLPLLKKGDLRAVASQHSLHPAVRQRARLLLGQE